MSIDVLLCVFIALVSKDYVLYSSITHIYRVKELLKTNIKINN